MRVRIANWGMVVALGAFAYFLIFGTFQNIVFHALIALYAFYVLFLWVWPAILVILFLIWIASFVDHFDRPR